MKKEEILEKSRKDNQKCDAYELEVENKATRLAGILMLVLATVYFVYEIMIGKGQNYAFNSLISLLSTVVYGYKAIKLEKCRILHVVCSVIWLLISIITIVQYFRG